MDVEGIKEILVGLYIEHGGRGFNYFDISDDEKQRIYLWNAEYVIQDRKLIEKDYSNYNDHKLSHKALKLIKGE